MFIVTSDGKARGDRRAVAIKYRRRREINYSLQNLQWFDAILFLDGRYAYAHGMPIIGHGIDIVETSRIRKMADDHGQHFLDRVFTPAEQAYCAMSHKRRYEHLAARFAAKEAVLKALGTGWRGGIAWTDIEVLKEISGQPAIVLTGECLRIARELGITRWHIRVSHVETHATASAIASGDGAAR